MKRLLLWLGIIAIILVGVSFILARIYEKEVKSIAVERLNTYLETEVLVKDLHFSLLQHFPNASLMLEEVRIKGSNPKDTSYLLEAGSVSLLFHPFDLFKGTYNVHQLKAREGYIHLKVDRTGVVNYDFIKSDPADTSQFALGLEEVTIDDMEVTFDNVHRDVSIGLDADGIDLSGKFSDDRYDLSIKALSEIRHLNIGGINYVDHSRALIRMEMSVDHETREYRIRDGAASIGSFNFFVGGQITGNPEYNEMDLHFVGHDLSLATLLDLLPDEHHAFLGNYEAKGNIDFKASLTGTSSPTSNPSFQGTFEVENGNVRHQPSGLELKEISFNGDFTNGKQRKMASSQIELDHFQALFEGDSIQAGIGITNFERPQLELNLASDLHLPNVKEFAGLDTLEYLKGRVHANFKLKTLLSDLNEISAEDLKTAATSGKLSFIDCSYQFVGGHSSYDSINGVLMFNNNDILVSDLSIVKGQSDFLINGRFINMLPYTFFEEEHMEVVVDAYANHIRLEDLLVSGNDDESGSSVLIPDDVKTVITLEARHLNYRKFNARDLHAVVRYNDRHLTIDPMRFNGMGGEFAGSFALSGGLNGQMKLKSKLKLTEVDIHKLFTEFENFGQKAIVAENIYGHTNADISFTSLLNPDFSMVPDRITSSAEIEINKGELKNYEPILAMSKYIEVEELNHIKFTTLYNQIEIVDEMIIIPEMSVNSSAIDLVMSGKHSFSNEIEYHFQLWLNDFLFKKAKRSKKHQTEFGEIEPDESGKAKLFVRVIGTVDDYKVKLDRKALRKKWAKDIQEEKQEVKALLREEFGKKDSSSSQTQQKEDFEMEWEEEDTPDEQDEKTDDKPKPKPEEKKKKKRKGLGKLLEENEDEYEEYDPTLDD